MNAGVRFAQTHNLHPGIALTGEQMAQLTSNMVWLVEREAALANGKRQKVLVPQLYLTRIQGSLGSEPGGSGGLISAGSVIHVDAKAHNVNNRGGTIAADKAVVLEANNIRHESAGRIQSDALQLSAKEDITLNGAQVEAGSTLLAQAGGNITIASTTRRTENGTAANGHRSTLRDRLASLSVNGSAAQASQEAGRTQTAQSAHAPATTAATADTATATNTGKGQLILVAGQNISLHGAEISNRAPNGLTHLQAGGDIELGTVWTESSTRHSWDARNYLHIAQGAELGSRILGQGDVHLQAGRDLKLIAEQERHRNQSHQYNKPSGIFSGGGAGFTISIGSSKSQSTQHYSEQTGTGSGLAALGDITLHAKKTPAPSSSA